jgi:hypothetical protein
MAKEKQMSIDIEKSFIIGVSFLDKLEEVGEDGFSDFEEKMSEIAEQLGLDFECDMTDVDETTDAFIGVKFRERPNDREVKEAKEKVTSKLKELEKLVGSEASSGVTEWMVVSFC